MSKEFLDDKLILERFRIPETKEIAFQELLKKYQQRLYWHIRRMVVDHDDTDDLIQEVFIKVWKNLHNFREDAQIYTWLYRIASNECISFLKKRKAKATVRFDDVSGFMEETYGSSDHYSGEQIQHKLQLALDTLPAKQRLVFNMKYYDNMKYEEISLSLGTSVGALKASYHIAVKKIEDFITQK